MRRQVNGAANPKGSNSHTSYYHQLNVFNKRPAKGVRRFAGAHDSKQSIRAIHVAHFPTANTEGTTIEMNIDDEGTLLTRVHFIKVSPDPVRFYGPHSSLLLNKQKFN